MTADLEPETEPIITRDVFPAEALLPDGTLHRAARVVLTLARVYVWVAAGRDGADLVFTAAYDPLDSALPRVSELRVRPLVVATPVGAVTVNRARGCGCGSPLKRFVPFSPARSGS